MNILMRSFVVVVVTAGLAFVAYAGPERMMESKEVMPAPVPDCCQWAGFYVGAHVGGQFGDSDDRMDFGANSLRFGWSYDESGIVAGGQAGYNLQWHSIVFGPEFDIGYMNLQGASLSPIDTPSFRNLLLGESSSDFYTTFRARIGVAHDCWLFYVTGGGIGVNYDTRITYIPNPDPATATFNGHKEDWDWGYCVGGGVERKIGCHWSIKLEYLYFNLEDQDFDRVLVDAAKTSGASAVIPVSGILHMNGDTDGHIVRAGLNYHF